MQYSTKQLSQLLGVGQETLRHYEKNGLLLPDRNSENGYRLYSSLDGLTILQTKLFQSYDLTLKEIATATQGTWSLEDQSDWLGLKQRELEKQISLLELKLARIKKLNSYLDNTIKELNVIREFEFQSIYKVLILEESNVHTVRINQIMQNWINHLPLIHLTWHINQVDLIQQSAANLPVRFGLGALEEFAELLQLDIAPPVFRFPSGFSVRTIIAVENPFHVFRKDFQILISYIHDNHYRICSDLTGRYHGCKYINGKRLYFFTARVLVQ